MGAIQQVLLGHGGAPAAAGFTWNPADKNANITLSGGDLTAVGTAFGQTVRGTVPKSSGKWYFECRRGTAVEASFVVVGIATAAASLSEYIGANASGYGRANTDNVYHNGGGSGGVGGAIGDEGIFMIAVDFGTGKFWVGRSGIFNGDPAAGTGQVYTITAGTYFPACSPRTDQIIIQNTLTYSPPSGFSKWS